MTKAVSSGSPWLTGGEQRTNLGNHLGNAAIARVDDHGIRHFA
jgi:hypothetical protein